VRFFPSGMVSSPVISKLRLVLGDVKVDVHILRGTNDGGIDEHIEIAVNPVEGFQPLDIGAKGPLAQVPLGAQSE
jgi:hypothetical protein